MPDAAVEHVERRPCPRPGADQRSDTVASGGENFDALCDEVREDLGQAAGVDDHPRGRAGPSSIWTRRGGLAEPVSPTLHEQVANLDLASGSSASLPASTRETTSRSSTSWINRSVWVSTMLEVLARLLRSRARRRGGGACRRTRGSPRAGSGARGS